MSHVAVGVARIPNFGPPETDDVPLRDVLGTSKYEVRFAALPRVGQRVVWGLYTWRVADVVFNVSRGPDGALIAGCADVELELAQKGGGLAGGFGGPVLARVVREEFLGNDTYAGVDVAFATLPSPGHYFFFTNQASESRFLVKRVTHYACEPGDASQHKPEVLVSLDKDWKPPTGDGEDESSPA